MVPEDRHWFRWCFFFVAAVGGAGLYYFGFSEKAPPVVAVSEEKKIVLEMAQFLEKDPRILNRLANDAAVARERDAQVDRHPSADAALAQWPSYSEARGFMALDRELTPYCKDSPEGQAVKVLMVMNRLADSQVAQDPEYVNHAFSALQKNPGEAISVLKETLAALPSQYTNERDYVLQMVSLMTKKAQSQGAVQEAKEMYTAELRRFGTLSEHSTLEERSLVINSLDSYLALETDAQERENVARSFASSNGSPEVLELINNVTQRYVDNHR